MTVGAIDIGTNSVRLLVLDQDGEELAREMRIARLGQGVDATRRLSDAAIERTRAVLREYAETLTRLQATRLRMTATSAARDATNRDQFFSAVSEEIGQEPELLSGEQEAQLSFLGATSSLPPSTAGFVVFDIGGGSTEFAVGTHHPTRFVSLDVGAVRVTERFVSTDPPTHAEIAGAETEITRMLDDAARQLAPRGDELWVGLAGTVTTFAAHAAGTLRYAPELTHGQPLSFEAVQTFSMQLLALPSKQRAALLVEPKRAEVIVGGALVLRSIMRYFHLESITTSEHDILDGLAASLR